MEVSIRKIQQADNQQVKRIIEKVMTEFGAVGEGYSIADPEVQQMYEYYQKPRHEFYVISEDEKVYGVGGLAPLIGANEDVFEVRKMYFLSDIRGKGLGSKLMHLILERAKALGFKTAYLETLESMKQANKLYEKFGFQKQLAPLGSTGHCGCDKWMALDLNTYFNSQNQRTQKSLV